MYILAKEEALSLAEWTSVLKLSAMWQMDTLRKIVMEKMSKLRANVTVEEWIAVLDMSVLLQLSDVRAMAIERLSSYGNTIGVDKILMARRYKMEKWFKEGCRELVTRDKCFSDEEEDRLGWKTVSKLYRARDQYLKSRIYRSYEYAYTRDPEADIDKEFEAELRKMREV